MTGDQIPKDPVEFVHREHLALKKDHVEHRNNTDDRFGKIELRVGKIELRLERWVGMGLASAAIGGAIATVVSLIFKAIGG